LRLIGITFFFYRWAWNYIGSLPCKI